MFSFQYQIKVYSGGCLRVITGESELVPGCNHIARAVPSGRLHSITGSLRLTLSENERFFMNGFQTWTFSPEYGRNDSMELCKAPAFLVKQYGLDRYGDDYFADPVCRKGCAHGESYCYFRRGADYRLFASLDETTGYTIFRYDAQKSILTVERDCSGVNCRDTLNAFDLYIALGSEDAVFDGWFEAMKIKPRTNDRIAGYSSWYNRYQNIDAAAIAGDLAGSEQVLEPGDLFQIDDGWEPAVGDWLETDKKKFPLGLKPQSDAIHAAGFRAGLWLAPFVAQKGSELSKKHKDWLLRDEDGEPWYLGSNWGGFYSLDFDNPMVKVYLKDVFRKVFDEWNFDLVKLDFLYGAAPFNTIDESRAAKMRRAMEFLRELCGDKLILGCGVPLMPAFGLVEYCRIGCDVGLDWDDAPHMRLLHRERVSTRHALYNCVLRRELNGRAFLNDPDVFFLREENLKLTEEQKYTLAHLNSLFGGVLLNSDDMGKYTDAMKKAYREIRAARDAKYVNVYADRGITVSWELNGQKVVHID